MHTPTNPMLAPDPRLERWARGAAADLEAAVQALLPSSGGEIVRWMKSLAPDGDIAAYYLHPIAFPMLRLALWLDEALGRSVDEALQADLVASTLSGYSFIRLIDDVMDRSPRARPDLLPALGFFHARFEAPYRRRFSGEPRFWPAYERIWSATADAAVTDASLQGDFTEEVFLGIAAGKVGAGRLPLLAVALHHGLDGIPGAWDRLFALMSAWHQMYNDLFDWVEDIERGGRTFILAEARRRAPGGDVPGWMAAEGVRWAAARMNGWTAEMRDVASRLGSPGLDRYLDGRQAHLDGLVSELGPGLAALAAMCTEASGVSLLGAP
jgi:hypothetical protein